jgi:hypothetical protein
LGSQPVQADGQVMFPAHELCLQSTEQPHDLAQLMLLVQEPWEQAMVQGPAPQVMFPPQELWVQVTVQSPLPQVMLPLQESDEQSMVQFLPWEQSTSP